MENTLSVVEELKYRSEMTVCKNTLQEEILDYLVLKGEVGETGVALCQKMFQKRSMTQQLDNKEVGVTFETMKDAAVWHGLTEKTCQFIHILEMAYRTSSEDDPLMAVVHAGRPTVAVGLMAVLSAVPCFDGMKTRVVPGDCNAAKSLEIYSEVLNGRGWQGAEEDNEALDEFGIGDAQVLIIANHNFVNIKRGRHPIAPAPLIIRFDGSNVDLETDGGGGHCRLVVFKADRMSGSKTDGAQERKKRKRSILATVCDEAIAASEK